MGIKIRKRTKKVCVVCSTEFMARCDSPGRVCSKSCRNSLGGKAVLGVSKNSGTLNGNYRGKKAKTPQYKLDAVNRWEEKNPEKRRAQDLAVYAVRKGLLIRQPCFICGSTHNIHGHHENYDKPLEIIWLCSFHHRARHKQLKKEKTANEPLELKTAA